MMSEEVTGKPMQLIIIIKVLKLLIIPSI